MRLVICLIILLTCCPVMGEGVGYNLKNTTANLMDVNERIVHGLGPLVFSAEEMAEVEKVMDKGNLLSVEEELINRNNLLDSKYVVEQDFTGEPEREAIYRSYATFAHYQEVVLLDDYFAGFDLILQKIDKMIIALEAIFYVNYNSVVHTSQSKKGLVK